MVSLWLYLLVLMKQNCSFNLTVLHLFCLKWSMAANESTPVSSTARFRYSNLSIYNNGVMSILGRWYHFSTALSMDLAIYPEIAHAVLNRNTCPRSKILNTLHLWHFSFHVLPYFLLRILSRISPCGQYKRCEILSERPNRPPHRRALDGQCSRRSCDATDIFSLRRLLASVTEAGMRVRLVQCQMATSRYWRPDQFVQHKWQTPSCWGVTSKIFRPGSKSWHQTNFRSYQHQARFILSWWIWCY